jgi:undecaprenyl-diphosphatase
MWVVYTTWKNAILTPMSDWLIAIILGFIEGITEFIPISSTGHLILVENRLSLSSGIGPTFNIAIQLGAIMAVVFLHHTYFTYFLRPKNWISKRTGLILTAIVPALLSGLLLYSTIKTHLFSPKTVLIGLFIGGVGLILLDLFYPDKESSPIDFDDITYTQAATIGAFQCLALWPGMSRSGSTIIGGVLAGLNRETSAQFSFIIAVPVMIAAVGYDLLKSAGELSGTDLWLIGLGFIIAFIVAYLSIVSFLKLLKTWKLMPFGIYRICLSLALGALFFL